MFKRLSEIGKAPSADALAQKELEDAKRSLLEAHSAVEYATAMVDYHSKRVRRLLNYTGATT